jgi:hypothetical protein
MAHDRAQTPCARSLEWKDVPEKTKGGLQTTRAEVDMPVMLHEVFLCCDQADEIATIGEPLVVRECGSFAHTSDDSMILASDTFAP